MVKEAEAVYLPAGLLVEDQEHVEIQPDELVLNMEQTGDIF